MTIGKGRSKERYREVDRPLRPQPVLEREREDAAVDYTVATACATKPVAPWKRGEKGKREDRGRDRSRVG